MFKKHGFAIFLMFLIIGFTLMVLSCPVHPQASTTLPEHPRVTPTNLITGLTGRTINATTNAKFQQALDTAQAGDTIVLTSGTTYTGNFKLRNFSGLSYVLIKSSASQLPAEGQRIGPQAAPTLAKIVTPDTQPAISTENGAHHYAFQGVEVGISSNVTLNYWLIALGDDVQSTMAQMPHDFIIDRCYIHGNDAGELVRGIALNSGTTSITNSYISNFHQKGSDSQAIACWNGSGPHTIDNNYIEGAAENLLYGGSDPAIKDLIPSDITITRNLFFKPIDWKGKWTVKNLFELKNAQRVRVEGNTFENNWVDAQSGVAILFTPRNQNNTAPWCVVQDVDFLNNIVKTTPGVFNLLGYDNEASTGSQQTKRIRIYNNLLYNIGNESLLLIAETPDVTVDHNTVIQNGNVTLAYGKPNLRFQLTNNIFGSTNQNSYGVFGENGGEGKAAITYHFPNSNIASNVLIGREMYMYPATGFLPALNLSSVGFVDAAGNFRLAPSSLFKGKATDGKDIGADIDQIQAAINGTVTPVTPPSGNKFQINQGVEAIDNVSIRSLPSTSSLRLGVAVAGRQGTVLEGPISADGYVWYKVAYTSPAMTGWSAEGFLKVALDKDITQDVITALSAKFGSTKIVDASGKTLDKVTQNVSKTLTLTFK